MWGGGHYAGFVKSNLASGLAIGGDQFLFVVAGLADPRWPAIKRLFTSTAACALQLRSKLSPRFLQRGFALLSAGDLFGNAQSVLPCCLPVPPIPWLPVARHLQYPESFS
jgi:hypothetical protein